MVDSIILPPGVSIAILAFLLSLLPAGMFMWLWYLRRHKRFVPIGIVITGFLVGAFLVLPAFQIEKLVPVFWEKISPSTAHYFEGAILPIQSIWDVLLPAVGTFLIVALVEEGLRYLFLAGWFWRSKSVDQIFDGLIVGLATGLGFATLENTLYFFELFSRGNFDTLVFVFFLRFLISTLAHISFGGIMGVLIARGFFSVYSARKYFWQAFLIPWFIHGLYDWLLGINQAMYAVSLLLPALIVLIIWSKKREFFVINRENGKMLIEQKPGIVHGNKEDNNEKVETLWNMQAPWYKKKKSSSGIMKKQ